MSDFQLHKNITFNISIMRILRNHRNEGDEGRKRFLQKPLIILNVSMIEALLYDFHKRVQWNTREGVAGLSMTVINYIRGKHVDKLETLIASSKKHDLFGTAGSTFYADLDQLRRIRNRMHIQNDKNDLEVDDHNAFSEARLTLSEQALEWVMYTLEDKYARPVNTYTAAYKLPWDTYFP